MVKKSNYKNSLKLIMQIQNIRKKNNVNWMDMLRLAFKHDSKGAAKIMSNIYTDDQRVSNLIDKLIKKTK